ncbi:nonribosomal peptide synthase pes1 [Trichophyton equinum CBS 127.97]|uniref:Nonribosomal peptide synthase pes1 n=1 Tax=Trichophyton equinum (strain ATCC MYA-4606 / CBS 127.97) TaxID=559882 RepID=F2PLE6_TRIEC|nr:nonribosomal peptide synthase pes1 [Trichophyton equinum CBS 127.97]
MRYQIHEGSGFRGMDGNTNNQYWGVKYGFDSTRSLDRAVPEPVEACIHSLIKRVAWEKPGAPAICSWDGDLTYLQLDQLSIRLACQLVNSGLTPGSRVILCFDETCLAPLSMLAVMKAGGISITHDTRQSRDHLQVIADQISPHTILSSSENEQLARSLPKGNVIIVDHNLLSSINDLLEPSGKLPVVSPSEAVGESYSVDSVTGIVNRDNIITHRDLSNAATYQHGALGLTSDTTICNPGRSFSDSAWSKLLILTGGGSLCIAPTAELLGNRHGLISALQSGIAVLNPESLSTLDNSELLQLVKLKYIAVSAAPQGLKNLGAYMTRNNESIISASQRRSGDMPASDVETNEIGKLAGKSNNQEVTIPEPRISSQDWQMSSTVNIHDLAGNHPEKMFAIDMYQKESPVQSRELWSSDSSNASPIASEGSFSSYEDAIRPVKATGNEPRIPDVLPFSLLSSSINKDEARAYASRLCNVKESQVIDIYPCTSLQEGLLALTAKREGSYVARNVFQIGDGINVNKLRHAWEQVVSMNPILRTRIVSLPHHGIMQVVLDEGAIWTSRGTHDDMVKFNPDNSQSFEGTADNPGHLIWEIHHALYDGWSIPLLLSQVENAYFNEFCQPLEPMAPFIKYIQDRDIGAAKAFWNDQFANIKGSHFPPVKPGYVPKQDCQIVRTISELPWGRSDFTPGTIVRAAWSIVAANGADSSEALFGVVVTGRQAPLPNIEFVAGPTIATLPIRVNVNWNENHKKFLDAVQRQSIEMIPFEQTGLQHISKVSQGTATACQFQTLLVVQPSSETTETTDRTFLSEVVDSQGGSQWQDVSIYPLVIECQLESESLKVSASFDSSVIGRQKMELVLSGFEFSIRQLSSGSTEQELLSSLVHDYSGLNDIWRWNREVPEATEACIHDLISRQVQENPQAQAICSWDGNMTYHELDSLSTDLAYQLVKRRVAGTVVPLLFEKSKFMPVAALAVMKAGGGCLPVDIKQPYERLVAISAQADSPIIISSVANEPVAVKLASGLELEREVLVVGPDQTLTFSAATPGPTSTSTASPSLPKVNPSDILYVVFTSGSTGTPKGVINTHRGLCSAITYQQKALGFSQTSRVFDFASYAFDAAWCNLLHAFTVGGTLCIPSQDERENDLAGCIEKYDVTTVDFTPSVARFLGPAVLSRLSTLILGGEAVLPSDAHLAGDDTTIINVYGPAECTPTATLSNITKATAIDIGRGAGACTWIVDPDDPSFLVPVGTVGELWLEGPLVGGGYLNDPEKTASAFVQNPPWLQHGLPAQHGQPGCPGRTGRLYRTGDLVQYREDGSLVFVGRKDNQVKIRGQRVELGEVEQNVLGGLFLDSQVHNVNITKTQVTAETIRPEGSNGAILVAFVTLVFEGDTEITEDLHTSAVKKATSGLSDRLAERLPVYMVPTSYIPILDLPMTATGKTDRKKLRSTGEYLWLKYRSDSDSDESTDSLNGVESTLQKVWMSVLNLSASEASVNKPFTRLNGDSITAMQVVSQCRLHNITVTVSQILQASTIRRLASICQVRGSGDAAPEDDDQADSEQGGKLFELGPIQQMFFDSYPHGLNHYNQTFVLELGKLVLPEAFKGAIRALVKRHASLRGRFKKDTENGHWMQTVCSEDDALSYAYQEHSVLGHNDVARIGQQRQLSLDIQKGPLFACDLFHIPNYPQVVILSAHHLVVDLVSWRIIWGDLEDFIEHGALISQPTSSFRAWCRRQAQVGRSLSPLSVLPYSMPETGWDFWGIPLSENTFNDLVVYAETFDEALTIQLFGDSNASLQTEPIDIILGAIAHSFRNTFSERPVPVIWTEGHGRNQSDEFRLDVSGTVGWFTTIQPLPVDISVASSVVDAIRMVKDRRSGLPGNGLPYFACRYYSESGRDAFSNHDIVEDGTAISPSKLEAVWRKVVGRHTILQSVFTLHPEGSGYIQIVLPKSIVRVRHITTNDNDPVSILSRLDRPTYRAHEPEHSFTICSSADGQVACRLDAIHTLIDGWSISVLVQDIIALYTSLTPAPAPPFGNIIRYISKISKAQRIASWTKLLSGVKPTEFPASPPLLQMAEEPHGDIPIPAEAIPGVLDVCKNLGITRSVFLQVAWAMLLSYFTGQSDVCFGYLSSCRDLPVDGVEVMVGPLANLLISRVDLQSSAKEVLKRVSEASIRHLEIQHTSLADIQHHVGSSAGRLFNTTLSIRGGDKLKGGDDAALSFESCTGEDPNEYDLNLSVNVDGDNMEAVVSFRPPYVNGQTAREASNVLTKAINYLVTLNTEDTDGTSLSSDFFRNIAGVNERSTQDFWSAQFSNTQGSHFPITESVTRRGTTNFQKVLTLRQLEWANCNEYSTSALIKAAWAIVSAKNNRSEEALFGEYSASTSGVLPVRIPLDWGMPIHGLLHTVQCLEGDIDIFSKIPLGRIRSINDKTHVGCQFRTTLQFTNHLDNLDETYPPGSPSSDDEKALACQYPLVVKFAIYPNSLSINIGCDSGILGEVEAVRIFQQFEHVLRQIIDSNVHNQKVCDVIVTSPQDMRDIWTWNNVVPSLVSGCAHELIIQQSRKTPLASAINAWDVSALAVMKTGAALVLTDPSSQPETRLRKISELVNAKICLCSPAHEALGRSLSIDQVLIVGPDHYQCLNPEETHNLDDAKLPNVDPADLFCLEKYRVTLADLTPSIARHLTGLEKLSTLVLGGEVVLPSDADTALVGDQTTVINAYGPAECTTTSTILNLTRNPHGGLGQGVGLWTWVVEPDDADTLAPLHAPGELWLEGPLVGEGYLNDPIRTAVSFIEDPVWLVQGVPGRHPGRRGRVYRTGDLVKYQEDGSIAYLGRKDTQVKIRGQRVELGEVEHWIESMIELPNDSSATVQVVAEAIQPRGVGNPILATFVSLGGSTSEPHDTLVKKAVQGLNDRLAASLSSYLIPSLYIPLQIIPRMATGKIDRSRLRSIGAALSAGEIAQLSRSESERLPPQTDAERLIQALWADILEINPDTISADDSFFRIGGDSIGAMRLVGMARQNNFSLTVRDIFRHPVLRDMAAVQA